MKYLRNENMPQLILTVAVIVIGTIFYFLLGLGKAEMSAKPDTLIFKELELKIALKDDGSAKLLAALPARLLQGIGFSFEEKNTLPNSMIIGYSEAKMMQKEGLFRSVGDTIPNFFGENVKISGILKKTGTIVDDLHFFSKEIFDRLDGDKSSVFILLKEGKEPKLFYSFYLNQTLPLEINLKEGSFKDYHIQSISGKTFYPIILGYDEAAMMRKEKLFANLQDKIENFFGRNVIIVGVLDKTSSFWDMTHLIPISKSELN